MNINKNIFLSAILIACSTINGMDLELTVSTLDKELLDITPNICSQADHFSTALNFSRTCKSINKKLSSEYHTILAENPRLIGNLNWNKYKELLDFVAQPENKNMPIFLAVKRCKICTAALSHARKPKTIEFFVLLGANCNAKVSDRSVFFSLCDTSRKGKKLLNALQLCIEKGAEVNTKDQHGYTPLFYACLHKNNKMAQFLLENGADVNAVNRYGKTALFLPQVLNDPQLLQLFLNNGANVNHIDNKGETALFQACSPHCLPFTIEKRNFKKRRTLYYLLQHGANVNVVNNKGEQAIQEACKYYDLKTIDYLMRNGAQVNGACFIFLQEELVRNVGDGNKHNINKVITMLEMCRLNPKTKSKVDILPFILEGTLAFILFSSSVPYINEFTFLSEAGNLPAVVLLLQNTNFIKNFTEESGYHLLADTSRFVSNSLFNFVNYFKKNHSL